MAEPKPPLTRSEETLEEVLDIGANTREELVAVEGVVYATEERSCSGSALRLGCTWDSGILEALSILLLMVDTS